MGGRRASTLGNIVGGGLGPQLGSFTRAVGREDPESITATSAKLVVDSKKISDILYLASKLADFVVKASKSKQPLNHEQRVQLARKEWSRIKKKEGIKDDPVVTDAIVFAAAKAIGEGRKS
jgi:cobalamin-dependent methionine synthase I